MAALDTVTEVPVSVCRSCGKKNDRASGDDGARPSAGDMSICVQCGEISIFTETLNLRAPTPEEAAEVARDPIVTKFRMAIASAHGRLAETPTRKQ